MSVSTGTQMANGQQSIAPSETPAERIARRTMELTRDDARLAATLPDPAINEAKIKPNLGLAQIMAICMEGYADRPALAQRATELVTDPATGRKSRRLLRHFETISYRDLWSRARAIASVWYGDGVRPVRANDPICILGSGDIDFVTVDLAVLHNGAVAVPMQATGATAQAQGIFNEVAPNWLATGIGSIETAVALATEGHRPKGILLFSYDAEVDEERERVEAARATLSAAGMNDLLVTLDEMIARAGDFAPAPLFAEPDSDRRLSIICYTSGSTGAPKGAMIPEAMIKPVWGVVSPIPMVSIFYMPLNHMAGRASVQSTLGSGGIGYFTAKSDLSEIFDDLASVRPTILTVVPRICEMLHQQYQTALQRKGGGEGQNAEALRKELLLEIREKTLGGRLLNCVFSAAPLSPELTRFMEECLGFAMNNSYGTTESGGVLFNNRVGRPGVIDYKLDDVPELGYFRTDKPHPRGELCVKTGMMMLGYYKRPDVTAQAFDKDGFYKTGDIMAEIGPEQLVYVDRRNNVLKLAQGEFVAISRLETTFASGHPAIAQVYLYGTSDRAFLVGVIVPNPDVLRDLGVEGDEDAIKTTLRNALAEVGRAEQLNSYEIPRDFIVDHRPFSSENGLLTGVGKMQRPRLKEYYGAQMEALYERIAAELSSETEALRREGRDLPVTEAVCRAVRTTLGLEELASDAAGNFADLGGDSLSALSCSLLLEEIFGIEVPVSIINNPAGDLRQLTAFIERSRAHDGDRPTFASVHDRGADEIRAEDLTIDRFLDADMLKAAAQAAPPATDIRTVLLTGASGYLGRFLCLEWLERMAARGGRVICIARGRDAASARQRIADALDSGDEELKRHFAKLAEEHLEVLAGDLDEFRLGLRDADWRRLAQEVDLIVHPAALVNHVLSYQQLFGPNVVGTAELIRLALTDRLKRFNYVSTMAAAMTSTGPVDEDSDVRLAGPVRSLSGDGYAAGYANSKWAGEVLLRDAHERFGLPVAVFRSDMILAHSRYRGQINISDMFTRWIISIVRTGVAPASFYTGQGNAHYAGLPVDFTARAIAAVGGNALSGYHNYHVLNPHDDGISLDSFVGWIEEAGHGVDRISDYQDWYGRFETALRGLPEEQRQHSSLPLIHQLRTPMPAAFGTALPATRFREAVERAGEPIPHLDSAFIAKCLGDIAHAQLIEGASPSLADA